MTVARIAQIWRYPVKSMMGETPQPLNLLRARVAVLSLFSITVLP